uniref:Coenzyme A biosynthesis bifunctional protein CoaBC n=1 Tax=uncultured Spirochaetales bacterium HF0500_06B09 TaxID=710994 RepID=E0XYA5_9SPIR|nr:phosphopantothenoylcysteine synthetase/decarboxylase [uncultured Spirochaetales bacterium HF0500_06B09]
MNNHPTSGNQFVGCSVLLCVTGGIAAYKAATLTSELVQLGIRVRVVMSAGAQRFIQPLTFQALTAEQVVTDLFDPGHAGVQHIELGKTHDLVLIAPASANTIYRLAAGAADDVVAATVLASPAPVLIAPAMESTMWEKPATQRNIQLLNTDGTTIIGPATGRLASGGYGVGRMAEPAVIVQHVRAALGSNGDLSRNTLLITAGGTREPIDPVRTLTNRSSGLMGAAIAVAARDRGAKVTLVTTAKAESEPGITVVPVETAAEMSSAVKNQLPGHDTLVMAAAVADFRPIVPANIKLKKTDRPKLTLTLEATQDILSAVTSSRDGFKRPTVVVGFAAETQRLIDEAREKIKSKQLDLIAANIVQNDRSPFGAASVALTLIDRNGRVQSLPEMPKEQAAHLLLDQVVKLIASSATD